MANVQTNPLMMELKKRLISVNQKFTYSKPFPSKVIKKHKNPEDYANFDLDHLKHYKKDYTEHVKRLKGVLKLIKTPKYRACIENDIKKFQQRLKSLKQALKKREVKSA